MTLHLYNKFIISRRHKIEFTLRRGMTIITRQVRRSFSREHCSGGICIWYIIREGDAISYYNIISIYANKRAHDTTSDIDAATNNRVCGNQIELYIV